MIKFGAMLSAVVVLAGLTASSEQPGFVAKQPVRTAISHTRAPNPYGPASGRLHGFEGIPWATCHVSCLLRGDKLVGLIDKLRRGGFGPQVASTKGGGLSSVKQTALINETDLRIQSRLITTSLNQLHIRILKLAVCPSSADTLSNTFFPRLGPMVNQCDFI